MATQVGADHGARLYPVRRTINLPGGASAAAASEWSAAAAAPVAAAMFVGLFLLSLSASALARSGPTLHLCPEAAPVCLGMDCQQESDLPADSDGLRHRYPRERGKPHVNVCVPRPAWMILPGVGLRASGDQPLDYVNQSQQLINSWPRPVLDSDNHTCTPENARAPDSVYVHVGGIIPDCDRHHLMELLAFLHDVLRSNNLVYWANYGTLLGAHREGGHIGHETDIDISVRRADYYAAASATTAAIQDGGLPYRFSLHRDRAMLYYSDNNSLHVDMWQAEIALSEPVDDRSVQAR